MNLNRINIDLSKNNITLFESDINYRKKIELNNNEKINDNKNMNEDLIELRKNIKEYDDYSKIEKHIKISELLFIIDKKGKYLLSQIKDKKYVKKKKSGNVILNDNMTKIYNIFVSILNIRKFIPRLYFTLQYYLDELLLEEHKDINTFFIEDNEYELTKLYFNQIAWILDQDIQEYQLDIGVDFNINESMFIVCFLREYEDVLLFIENYIIEIKMNKIKQKLLNTIIKIKKKLKIIWDIILEIINNSLYS